MAEQKRRWVLKDIDGRVRGPYSTEKIIHKINSGELSGEELIALYPGGRWFSISREPEFYDRLLDALSGSNNPPPTEDESAERTSPKSRSAPVSQTAKPEDSIVTNKTPHPINETDESPQTRPQRNTAERFESVIELMDVNVLVKKEVFKQVRWPVIIVVALGFLVVLFLMTGPKKEQEERIHLLPVQEKIKAENPDEARARIKRTLPDFLRDTYTGYLRAENEFIQILQMDPKNSEVLALLCLTYNELWPLSFQDSQDLKTISMAAQIASQADLGGQNSGVCKVIDLLVRGRSAEAKSFADSVLESTSANDQPPILFYYLKALLLESSNELQTAIGYTTSAQQLWPQWMRVYVYDAELQTKNGNPTDAAKIYNEVLRVEPNHVVSQIELGLLEYKYFQQFEKAQELLSAGLNNSEEKINRGLQSKAYFGLAEIALHENDQSRALSYAQQAYSISSSNTSAKNLIIQIGGIDKLKKTKIKGQHLIYEGDQFVREGDCQSAQAHFKAAYEENNKNAIAAMKAAKCLWQLSLTTEALEWLNKAIKADPKLIEGYVQLADYYTQRYNFDAAARVLAAAQHVSPRSYEVFSGFAMVELRRNNPQAAIGFAKKALALYGTDSESYIILAKSYLALQSKESYQLAYQAATKATEIDVNNREAQIVYAQALAGIQGLDIGMEHLRKLVATYPLVVEYQLALGKLLLSDERFEQAEQVFRRIIKLQEKPKEALVLLSKSLKNQGRAEEALDSLLRAAVLDPADPEPLFQAALLYLENNRQNDAKIQLERVLRINPSYPLVHYYIGRAALAMSQPENALKEAELERKSNPNLPEAYMLAAEAHTQMKQYSLCAGEYQQALRLRPQGAKIYVMVARCYRLAENFDVASAMLDIAAKRESGYAEIYKERGQLYEMQGDAQRAIEAYNQYFVLDPNAPDRAQIYQRLQLLQKTH